MPPVSTDEAAGIAYVLLKQEQSQSNRCVVQSVYVGVDIDAAMVRDIQRAAHSLEDFPIVEAGSERGIFLLNFPFGTVVETIPAMVKQIIEELAVRLRLHSNFRTSGPAMAITSELESHMQSNS